MNGSSIESFSIKNGEAINNGMLTNATYLRPVATLTFE